MIWLSYFFLSIVVIGFTLLATIFMPCLILSRWIPQLAGIPSWILQKGVWLLMWVQPWFRADVKIDLPNNGQGTLIVSNHRSTLDVFILLSQIRGIRIMARNGLYKIPFLAMMMRATRQIRVEKGHLDSWVKGLEQVRTSLERGDTVHIFPEMTRCPRGYVGLQGFVSGPFHTAILSGAQVVPLIFDHTDAAWPKGQAGIERGAPIRVRTLPPIQAAEFDSADQLKHTVREKMLEVML
jgi:1-acyl-sn-glycerol-3-phosphate acyltransferase